MRIALSVIFSVLIVALLTCSIIAFKSRKPIGKYVSLLVFSLIPPVIGNLFIISSPYEMLSTIGCYIYFIGMDFVMFALVRFILEYCNVTVRKFRIQLIFGIALFLDTVQLLVNIGTHHAFTLELIQVYGGDYWRFIPLVGQYIHRVVDYVILGGVLINLIIKTIKAPKVYAEKYIVILLAMVAVAAWQTFYIFSRTPMDISMTGFGVFGILVFALALFYRPLRLLDRMLAAIASRMPEALIFFDRNGKCIWANEKTFNVLNIDSEELDNVSEKLKEKFGDFAKEGDEWESTFVSGDGDNVISFVIEKHAVIDDKKRVVGSYLSLRDNSIEQKNLQRETYNAHHDALTKVFNRAGYDALMSEIDYTKSFLLLVDVDSFKQTNDEYGHIIGDEVLIKIVNIIKENFREEDHVCRIGGDEFAIVIVDANELTSSNVKKRIDNVNKILKETSSDSLPPSSISAGGAYGKDAENIYELFNNADHALYETKFNGKCGYTKFTKR